MAGLRQVAFFRRPERRLLLELYLESISAAASVQAYRLFRTSYPVRRALARLYLQETYLVCPGASLLEPTWHAALLQAK